MRLHDVLVGASVSENRGYADDKKIFRNLQAHVLSTLKHLYFTILTTLLLYEISFASFQHVKIAVTYDKRTDIYAGIQRGRDYMSNYESLHPLFKPKTVAVLGASTSPYKIGYLQVKSLVDGQFEGDIFPIHPSADNIAGLTCYPSLSAVPKPIDLVIFCVGYEQIQAGLEDCAANNVKSAIIFASGFSEAGAEGQQLQQQLAALAKQHGIRVVGPNCVGLVNTSNGLIGTFTPSILSVKREGKQGVGYISQSGAFGILTYMAAAKHGVLFNYFVSSGNEMESTFEDFLEYMVHDDETTVISGYLEGAKNPEKLKQLAEQALIKKKPIILMKTGRSDAGSRAAASHTGSLAGSDQMYDAFFKQYGIIRAEDFDDIIAISKLFQPDRLPTGKNTVIITSSGGRGINEADRCESYGLNIIELSEQTQAAIYEHLPSYASVHNPIDLTAAASVSNPEYYLHPMKALLADSEVDNIIFTEFPYMWTAETPELQQFIELCNASDKTVLVCPFPLNEQMTYPAATPTLVANGISVIPTDLNPIRALAKLVDYSERIREEKSGATASEQRVDISDLVTYGQQLSEAEAGEVLKRYNIPTVERHIVNSEEEAVEKARAIGYPVVLKIDSPDIPHKTEADAIRLNVMNDDEAIAAFNEIMLNSHIYDPGANLNGVSVQPMLDAGVEIIIGAHNDPTFGPVIMAGLGGIFVEVFKDVAFKVAPLTRTDAEDLLNELKGNAILQGARGKAPVDREAIIDVLLNVSRLMTEQEDLIQELDINPIIAYENGVKAADCMIAAKQKTDVQQLIGG